MTRGIPLSPRPENRKNMTAASAAKRRSPPAVPAIADGRGREGEDAVHGVAEQSAQAPLCLPGCPLYIVEGNPFSPQILQRREMPFI